MSSKDALKEAICNTLAQWIRQRPGLKPDDYGNAYRAVQRQVARDKRDAETLLEAVRRRHSLSGKDIIEASKTAFSGRLQLIVKNADGKTMKRIPSAAESMKGRTVELDFTPGQCWPEEYRAAAAAVLALALRQYVRSNMPKPDGKTTRTHGPFSLEVNTIDGVTEGDWFQRHMRREFGQALQRRWFD